VILGNRALEVRQFSWGLALHLGYLLYAYNDETIPPELVLEIRYSRPEARHLIGTTQKAT
jgi:hypothetical protein